ncbi:MAG: carboxylating nicotinate-nucleotide diphosphorylase [Syntrophorhabdaceae bacterium]|nr:carboxylating nicotinate-nucleotide diphosphorylase [Syntrophorhabdaceae bacterium]
MNKFLEEDIGEGDRTTQWIVPEDHRSQAIIVAKQDGIIAGHRYAQGIFRVLDNEIEYNEKKADGDLAKKGDAIVEIKGRTRAILTGERVGLNILQRLSGIATLTREYVDAVKGTRAKILDTRKTTPGLREMEKYAVKVGGGENHRMTLSDMVLIKENHITVAGSIREAIRRVKGRGLLVEVEVKNMEELKEALDEGVDRVLIDNWDVQSTGEAVNFIGGMVPVEASGDMTVERARMVAKEGVDYISVGALTHSFKSMNLSLLLI